jgi:hypothetical protein
MTKPSTGVKQSATFASDARQFDDWRVDLIDRPELAAVPGTPHETRTGSLVTGDEVGHRKGADGRSPRYTAYRLNSGERSAKPGISL